MSLSLTLATAPQRRLRLGFTDEDSRAQSRLAPPGSPLWAAVARWLGCVWRQPCAPCAPCAPSPVGAHLGLPSALTLEVGRSVLSGVLPLPDNVRPLGVGGGHPAVESAKTPWGLIDLPAAQGLEAPTCPRQAWQEGVLRPRERLSGPSTLLGRRSGPGCDGVEGRQGCWPWEGLCGPQSLPLICGREPAPSPGPVPG